MNTEQGIFNRVWNHMAVQRVASYGYDSCKYRDEKGNACAVGCLIGNATAKKLDLFTDASIRDIYTSSKDKIPKWMWPHIDFLQEIQDAHDINSYQAGWYERFCKSMREIATERNLKVPS